MVIKNLWRQVSLACEVHNCPLQPTANGKSLFYECEKHHQKEMCSLVIDTKTFEKLILKLSEEISEREQEDIYGPLGKWQTEIGNYTFTLKEQGEESFVFAVRDKRFLKK